MTKNKQTLITFKVDDDLAQLLKGLPNRSEFIRSAILAALDSVCPLCRGTGILTASQRRHWEAFAEHHRIQECPDCHVMHLVCEHIEPGEAESHEHQEA